MDTRNKAEKFWDRTARSYDQEEKKDEDIHLHNVKQLKEYLQPSDLVLDLGCGTGLFSAELAPCVKKIQAIDLSSKMIELAKTKAKVQGLTNIEYTHTTIFDETLKPETFNVILACYVLHLVDDLPKVIERISELLTPDGILLSITPCMGEKPLLSGLFSMVSKLGIVPKINAFKRPELIQYLTEGNLNLVKHEKVAQTTNEYFIAARK